MHEIERTEYGLRIDLDGTLTAADLESFQRDVGEKLETLDPGFGIVADMQGVTVTNDAKPLLAETMKKASEAGFERSAVAVDSPILDLQQDQLEEDAGVDGERVIDTTEVDDWERAALDWVKRGIEPGGETP